MQRIEEGKGHQDGPHSGGDVEGKGYKLRMPDNEGSQTMYQIH